MSLVERAGALFGVDDPWERPAPTSWRGDVIAFGVFLLVGALEQELLRSYVPFDAPRWRAHLAFLALLVPLLWRRRRPLLTALVSAVGMFVVSTGVVPEVGFLTTTNVACFFATYSGIAWAKDRRAVPLGVGAVLVLVLGWYAAVYAWGNGVQTLVDRGVGTREAHGFLPPIPASIVFGLLMNLAFFSGAIAMGATAWRQARDRARLAEQAAQIAAQQEELQDQAVVAERLRIARELHDVSAQHVAAMGVQASAARRLMSRRPDEAEAALGAVEESARRAVTEMRHLLGTLRGGERGDDPRAPEPGLAELPALVAQHEAAGLAVSVTVVEETPGDLARVPAPLALSLYRTVQEALTNVGKHSTARHADLTLRTLTLDGTLHAEAEVLDQGRPRTGTSGTGLGMLGIRERVATHQGTCEIGPRALGGYRVRVRFPLPRSAG